VASIAAKFLYQHTFSVENFLSQTTYNSVPTSALVTAACVSTELLQRDYNTKIFTILIAIYHCLCTAAVNCIKH